MDDIASHHFTFIPSTLPKTNIAPEHRPLEKGIPIGNHHFQMRTVSFREGRFGDPLSSVTFLGIESPCYIPVQHDLPNGGMFEGFLSVLLRVRTMFLKSKLQRNIP